MVTHSLQLSKQILPVGTWTVCSGAEKADFLLLLFRKWAHLPKCSSSVYSEKNVKLPQILHKSSTDKSHLLLFALAVHPKGEHAKMAFATLFLGTSLLLLIVLYLSLCPLPVLRAPFSDTLCNLQQFFLLLFSRLHFCCPLISIFIGSLSLSAPLFCLPLNVLALSCLVLSCWFNLLRPPNSVVWTEQCIVLMGGQFTFRSQCTTRPLPPTCFHSGDAPCVI